MKVQPHLFYTRRILILFLLLSPQSCAGRQSSLDPAGLDAAQIGNLFWLMVAVSAAVFLLVIATLAYSVVRARARNNVLSTPEAEGGMRRSVSIASAATAITLFALLVTSVLTGRALTTKDEKNALNIELIGHQWWWEVQYRDAVPGLIVKTANEIHLPINTLVKLKLTSHDVIHSFWAPNFTGKKDLIPGHETTAFLQADRIGIFRGQCAEFCGHQHAHMAFDVIVQSPEDFRAWYEHQLQVPSTPFEPAELRGQKIFLTSRCVMCHAIAGTTAGASAGPDLTHIAGRLTIAAGTLSNTREHLESWIKDSQNIKPGNKMPRIELAEDDIQALLAYLETLN